MTRTTIILIEKVGTRLTISTATTSMTSAFSTQLRGQIWPRAKVASIGMITQPAAAGAGRPVKNRLIQLGCLSSSSSVLKRARRNAQQVANSSASDQPTPGTWLSVQR